MLPDGLSNAEYGVHLAEITLDAALDWPIRQLAAVLLKQFIESHWSVNREKFEEPEIASDVKIRIRTMLISGASSQHAFIGDRPWTISGIIKKLITTFI